MTLEDPSRIDIVTREKDGRIALVIVDAGVTTDPQERFDMLLSKLKAYVNYVMSIKFKEQYLDVRARDVLISVVCRNPPTEAMKRIENVGPSGDRVNRLEVRYTIMDYPDMPL